MRRAILLRHGVTEANRLHRYCGSTDLPLDEAALAEHRARQLQYPDPTGCRVLTSGLLRTEQTLRALYGDIPHEADPAFRELDFGAFENKSYEELRDDPAYQAWLTGDNEQNPCPGGESGAQMAQRVLSAWNALTEDTLLVTHGGVIACIMAQLFPDAGKTRYQWQPAPFEGYLLQWKGDAVTAAKIP